MTLDLRTEVNLGSWTQLPATGPGSLRNTTPVTITRGRPDNKASFTPATALFGLDNRDGRWTIRNPVGTWYGKLVQDTPIRFSLPASLAGLSNYLRFEGDSTSYAYTPDGGPGQFVQSASATGAASPVTVTLPNPTTPGNTLVVCTSGGSSGNAPSVTGVTLGGAAGNFAQVISVGAVANLIASQWADPNCAGGQTSVAVSFSSTGTPAVCIEVLEFAGVLAPSPVDQSSSTAFTTAATWTSGTTLTTTQASEIAIGCVGAASTGTITGPVAPWVNQAQVTNTPGGVSMLTGYDILSSTGTVTYNGSFGGSTGYVAAVVTYKAQPASALRITGPIDVRVDCWPSDYQPTILAAKYGGTAQSWAFVLGFDFNSPFFNVASNIVGSGTLAFYWFDGANTQALACNQLLPYFGQRICLRVLFTPSTGTAQFYTAPTMAGPFTQLGANQVFGATTLSAGAGQPVQVGGSLSLARAGHSAASFTSVLGMVYEAQILSPPTTVADPVFSSQTAGVSSLADAQSNTWTLSGTSEISSRLYRFHGELAVLPKQATPNSANAYVSAQAGGVTRRLQQAQTPLNSAMYRAYVRLPASLRLAAYWPFEDGATATKISSALGGPAMGIYFATPNLASNSDFVCSAPLPVMNGAAFSGVVTTPPGFTWQDNCVRFLWEVPAGGEVNISTAAQYTTTGTAGYVTLVYGTGGTLNMSAFTTAGGTLLHSTGNVSFGVNGQKLRVAFDLKQNGGNVDMTIAVLPLNSNVATVFTATAAFAGTIGAVTRAQVGGAGISGSVMGHLSVQGVANSLFDIAGALNAWNGEPAATRIARLCSEEGIACRIIGPQAASIAMGNQTIQTFMSLLQECEATDQGMLFEPRQALGIGYVTQRALCGQPAMATVAFGGNVDPAFSPASDDTLVINDVTMTAAGGTTSRQVLSKGPMSTAAPPSGVGRFDTTVPVNPSAAQSLDDLASWYLHIHSADEDRYPSIPFQLARSGAPQAVPLLDIGSYLSVTAVPSWVPPPPVRQLVAGYTETIGPQPLWSIAVNGIPEAPYETAFADSSRAQTPGSTVHANTASGSGTFQADSVSDVWTQAAGDYPFDLLIAGQRITVSACSGSSSPQTFTVSAWGVNGVTKNLVAGDQILVYQRPWAGLT